MHEAARTVRDENERGADAKAIFSQTPSGRLGLASFAVEMVIPSQASDDLGHAGECSKPSAENARLIGRGVSDSRRI